MEPPLFRQARGNNTLFDVVESFCGELHLILQRKQNPLHKEDCHEKDHQAT